MKKNIKRTITVVMVLMSVLLLVSPMVFAKPFVRVDDEGLKGLQIRTSIIKGNDVLRPHGPNCGRVQLVITEAVEKQYTYRFSIDLKKAPAETDYSIWVWADLPEEVIITIYGDGNNLWPGIEWVAYDLGIDNNPFDHVITATVGELLGAFGFTEEIIQMDTGLTFTTDSNGERHNIRSGSMSEDEVMEYALDLIWPKFRLYLLTLLPGAIIPEQINFNYLGVIGLWVHGGEFSVSGGVRLIGPEGLDGPNNFHTEPITINRVWNDFKWGIGPP